MNIKFTIPISDAANITAFCQAPARLPPILLQMAKTNIHYHSNEAFGLNPGQTVINIIIKSNKNNQNLTY